MNNKKVNNKNQITASPFKKKVILAVIKLPTINEIPIKIGCLIIILNYKKLPVILIVINIAKKNKGIKILRVSIFSLSVFLSFILNSTLF